MENNTLISSELEQMRAQIDVLKEKLDKQNIINDQHIRRSMKSKMSDINKIVTVTICLGVFALIFSTGFFYWQRCTMAFVIFTAVMLATCLALTIEEKIRLGDMDFSKGNLVETAKSLSKIRTRYKNWYKIAVPVLIIWFVWMTYEMAGILGLGSMTTVYFSCGATIGIIAGGIAGFSMNRKIVRKATEILEQIEELQQGSC